MMNVLIALGISTVIGYALIAHLQNRSRRRVQASADGGNVSSGSDAFSLGSWFSSDSSSRDSSSNATDSGSCFSSDSGGSSGGDCGGGDGGGGGGGD